MQDNKGTSFVPYWPAYRTATNTEYSSGRWAQSCSKNVEDSNKYIIEETVCQVGHLPELHEDAQSEKHKI